MCFSGEERNRSCIRIPDAKAQATRTIEADATVTDLCSSLMDPTDIERIEGARPQVKFARQPPDAGAGSEVTETHTLDSGGREWISTPLQVTPSAGVPPAATPWDDMLSLPVCFQFPSGTRGQRKAARATEKCERHFCGQQTPHFRPLSVLEPGRRLRLTCLQAMWTAVYAEGDGKPLTQREVRGDTLVTVRAPGDCNFFTQPGCTLPRPDKHFSEGTLKVA